MYMPRYVDIDSIKMYGVYKDAHYVKCRYALDYYKSKKPELKVDLQLLMPMDYEMMMNDLKKDPRLEDSSLKFMKTSTSPLIIANGKYVITPKDLYDRLYDLYEYYDKTVFPIYNRMSNSEYAEFFTKANPKKVQHVYIDFVVNTERHSDPQRVIFELYVGLVPKTCRNFIQLLEGSFTNKDGKKLHYKGTTIHKIWADGFIQGGDVDHEGGKGGQSVYGKYFEDENFILKHDKPGILGMANHGKRHTNSSQFYITLSPLKAYDNRYVVFGRVISGFRTIKFINRIDTFGTKPNSEVFISDCGVFNYNLKKIKKEL